MKDLFGEHRRRRHRMWTIYSVLFVLVVLGGYFISRRVINQPWSARSNAGSAVVEDHIYIVGGQSDSTGRLLDEVVRVNVERSTVSFVAHLPYVCYLPATAADEDALFVAGGYDGRAYRSEIVRVVGEDVRVVGHLPSSRSYGAAVVMEGILYYAGGWDGNRRLDEIVAVDLTTGESSIVAHLSSPRQYVSASAVAGRAYFVGGEEADAGFSDEIVEFDPLAAAITRVGHLPSGRYLTNVVPWNGGLLVLTGKNERYLDDVVTVTLSEDGIRSETTDHIPELTWHLAVQVLDNRIFIIGGATTSTRKTLRFLEYIPETKELIPFELRGRAWR
jgi:hypothetical protein